MGSDNGSTDAATALIPPEILDRIPRTSIDDDPEVPADTAYMALCSPLGIHLIALGYRDPDVDHLWFALTVNRDAPRGEWADIDLRHLVQQEVALEAVPGWTPQPIAAACAWAREQIGA